MLIEDSSATIGYTSLTHSSTIIIPATHRYAPLQGPPDRFIADGRADKPWWELMTWPARRPTLEELHWVAGLFEGEGSFCDGHVCIPQNDREILDHVRQLLGGRVGGPYVRNQRGGRRTRYHLWYASGPRGRSIARTLFHLLSSRRQAQARIFLRIPRNEAPPKLDPADPAGLLWDWAPADELEVLEP